MVVVALSSCSTFLEPPVASVVRAVHSNSRPRDAALSECRILPSYERAASDTGELPDLRLPVRNADQTMKRVAVGRGSPKELQHHFGSGVRRSLHSTTLPSSS